jgi:hypothetical protein
MVFSRTAHITHVFDDMIPMLYDSAPLHENLQDIITFCTSESKKTKKGVWFALDDAFAFEKTYEESKATRKQYADMIINRKKYGMNIISTAQCTISGITNGLPHDADFIFITIPGIRDKKIIYEKYRKDDWCSYDEYLKIVCPDDRHAYKQIPITVIDIKSTSKNITDCVFIYNMPRINTLKIRIGSRKLWQNIKSNMKHTNHYTHPDTKLLTKALIKSRDKAYFRHNLSVVKQYFDIKLKFYY